MMQATRAMIAPAAAERAMGRHVARLYDHSLGQALPVPKHLPADRHADESHEAVVLHLDPHHRVSLEVHEDLFSGWDHTTGSYFAGAVYESDVMIYDGYDGCYYKFSIH